MRWMVLLVVLLGGCALWPAAWTPPGFAPLAPAGWPVSYQRVQAVRLQRQDHVLQLITVLDRTPQHLEMRGLSPLGVEVLRVDYDGGRLQTVGLAESADRGAGRQIVADLQLASWPLDALRSALEGSAWSVRDSGRQRELRWHGRPVARVEYGDRADALAPLKLFNVVLGYTLEVTPLSAPSEPK